MPDGVAIESILRRDQRIAAAGIIVLCALAWGYLLAGAGMGMSLADMAGTALFPHTQVERGGMEAMAMEQRWSSAYGVSMVLMWWVMMIAMMTPSASPMILLHARVAHDARARGKDPRGKLEQTAVFAGSYLGVWLAFALAAATLQWVLEQAGLVSAMMMSSLSAPLSALILVGAGIYQWTPLKSACLRNCRSPASFLSRHWRPGRPGAVRLGVLHGAYCVGCCWALMTLLFVGGVMNLIWVAALAIVVLLEKTARFGVLLSRAGGVLLIVWGVAALLV